MGCLLREVIPDKSQECPWQSSVESHHPFPRPHSGPVQLLSSRMLSTLAPICISLHPALHWGLTIFPSAEASRPVRILLQE